MDPSDESSLALELERLQRRVDYLDERHTETIQALREDISSLTEKLGKNRGASSPPPIPQQKSAIPEKRQPPVVTPVPHQEPTIAASIAEIPTPAPTPSIDPVPHQENGSFELQFGKVWFVRIGIVILLTGLVFLGNYAYQNWIREMPNGVRLASLFLCAGVLIEAGRRLAAKENLNRFGEVLLAGGMAFFYYCTFAAHHVGRLQIIDSPVIAAILLFAAAGAIAAVSWLRQAKATAALGFVLAAYATMLQPIGWMSCISNVLLGAMGLFFMLKPGWSGPGWASMLGSYGAFFGWQVLGATGKTIRTDDPAILWFLPPLWVMFAIPGVLGRFRESLSDRARAWFTGANNAFFFLLFSGVWIAKNGDTGYWIVPAVFGTALIALGILGRRQSTTAGGVNIAQGLAIATFALVLKLDGHHLALVLAFESLTLAMAAWKFRGKSESVFSLLAGLGSTGLVIYSNATNAILSGVELAPIWSIALVALLLLASSRMTMRSEITNATFLRFLRASAAILFTCAALITTHLCLDRLDEIPGLLTTIILALTLSIATIRFDEKRKQLELIIGAIWFLCISVTLGFRTENPWPLAVTTLISLAACWLWHQPDEVPVDSEGKNLLDTRSPSIPAWCFSLTTPYFAALTVGAGRGSHAEMLIFVELAAFILAAVAIALRCKRLLTTASVTALLGLLIAIPADVKTNHLLFLITLIALVPAALIHLPWSRERINENHRASSSWLFRTAAFIAYCAAWYMDAPDTWSDWLALSSIALTLLAFFQKRKLFAESVGLICVGLVAFFFATASSPWHLAPDETGWRGITVVIALLSLVLTYRQRPALITNPALRHQAITILAGLSCFVTTIWTTQMLVWRFGWKPTAVLWTVLGFAFVSAGLWQRLHILRVSGFLLLIISFGKLFLVDVWDFTTFMRVVSFIVLGAALILLGLFYNKFADVIKTLLDDEKGGVPIPTKPVPDEEK